MGANAILALNIAEWLRRPRLVMVLLLPERYPRPIKAESPLIPLSQPAGLLLRGFEEAACRGFTGDPTTPPPEHMPPTAPRPPAIHASAHLPRNRKGRLKFLSGGSAKACRGHQAWQLRRRRILGTRGRGLGRSLNHGGGSRSGAGATARSRRPLQVKNALQTHAWLTAG